MKRKHLLIMLLCCLPVIGLLVAYLLGAPLGSGGFLVFLLLCPLMHLFLMRGMGHDHDHAQKPTEETNK